MNHWINSVIGVVKARPFSALILLVVLLAVAFAGYSSCRGKLYDRSDAKHEAEKQKLREERDAAIRKANEAEAKATLLEVQNAKTDELIAAKGGAIEAAKEKLDAQIETAKRDAGVCADLPDAVARRDCVLSKLRAR